MRLQLLLILTVIFSFCAQSQKQHYTIKYSAGFIDTSGNFIEHAPIRVMVIERKESYEFLPFYKEKINEPLGSKFREHSVYTDLARGISFYQSDPSGYPKFLVEDTLIKINWKIEAGTRLIAGYKCKVATANINGTDLQVFYSEELPKGFGPFNVTGLSGTILEIHSRQLPYSICVTEIIKGGYTLQKPDDGKPISREEYTKIVAKIAKNSQRNRGALSRKVGEYSTPSSRFIFRSR